MSRKIYKIEGLVIDKRDRGEQDIIFTILTPDEGKMEVLAKYAKKVPSRHNSGLEIFNGVQCQLYQGKILPMVTQSKQIFSFPHLLRSYDTIRTGFLILQYIKLLTATHQPILRLYDLTVKTLELINKGEDIHIIQTVFLLKLMYILGIFHLTDQCESCRKIKHQTLYLTKGMYLCKHCTSQKDVSITHRHNIILQTIREKTFEEILTTPPHTSSLHCTQAVLTHFLVLSFPDQHIRKLYQN